MMWSNPIDIYDIPWSETRWIPETPHFHVFWLINRYRCHNIFKLLVTVWRWEKAQYHIQCPYIHTYVVVTRCSIYVEHYVLTVSLPTIPNCKTRSTQKSPVRHQNAWFDPKSPVRHKDAQFDTKMPSPACIKHPPAVRNIFPISFQYFFLKLIEKWKWNHIDMNSSMFNIIMKI